MSSRTHSSGGRREFLGQLATAAVAIAGSAYAGSGASAQAALPSRKWDDAWVARITGRHKAVFDAPEIAGGVIVTNAWVWMKGFKDVYGLSDNDLSAVLVIRHAAIAMALDDEMWAKYELGRNEKVRDERSGKWAIRNPFWRTAPDESSSEFNLESLQKRGAILMACDLAVGAVARRIAQRTKQEARVVREEVNGHLLPGLTLAPSGVFATMRAQEAGCAFLRST